VRRFAALFREPRRPLGRTFPARAYPRAHAATRERAANARATRSRLEHSLVAKTICRDRGERPFAVLFSVTMHRIAEIQGFGLYTLLWRSARSVMCSRRISAAPRFSRVFLGMRDVPQEQSRITASPAHRKVGAVLVLLNTRVRVLALRPRSQRHVHNATFKTPSTSTSSTPTTRPRARRTTTNS
jgi:hypothetical protein